MYPVDPLKWSSLVVYMVKNLPANAGDVRWICGLEDLLEKKMAIHSSIPAWEIPHTEEPGKVHGVTKQSDMT